MPDQSVITVRRQWGLWQATIPGQPSAVVESTGLRVLLGLVHIIGQAKGLRVEVWDEEIPPPCWVCGWPMPDRPDGACGLPVDTGPCRDHWPTDDDVAALLSDAATRGRHPLGRRGAGWLPAVVLAVAILAGLVWLGWWLL